MKSWTINRYFVGLQPGQQLAVEHDHVAILRLRAVSAARRVEITPLEGGQFIVRTAIEKQSYLLVECNQEELGNAVLMVLFDEKLRV